MSTDQTVTLESLCKNVRKTAETPPRVAVYDVIETAKGCDGNEAARIFRRLRQAGNIPACKEVSQNLLKQIRLKQFSHGGARNPVKVATAQEMVQIL